MWMTIISFIGGPVIKGLIDGYKAKLAAGNTSEKIASDTASAEIAAQVSETNAIMRYRIAEIGHWHEPDKLMGYFVIQLLLQRSIWAICFANCICWSNAMYLKRVDVT